MFLTWTVSVHHTLEHSLVFVISVPSWDATVSHLGQSEIVTLLFCLWHHLSSPLCLLFFHLVVEGDLLSTQACALLCSEHTVSALALFKISVSSQPLGLYQHTKTNGKSVSHFSCHFPLVTNCYVNLAHVALYMYVELNVSQLDA